MCLKKIKKYSYVQLRSAMLFAEKETAKVILNGINKIIPSAPPRMLTGTEQDVLKKVEDFAAFYGININAQEKPEQGAKNERNSKADT